MNKIAIKKNCLNFYNDDILHFIHDTNKKKDFILGLLIFFISCIFWFVMNINFQPRFSLEPYKASIYPIISFMLNASFTLLLVFHKKLYKFAFLPAFFLFFPVAFIIISLLTPLFNNGNFQGDNIYIKFLYDNIFFTLEIILALPIFIILKTSNPFKLKKEKIPMQKTHKIIRVFLFSFTIIFFLGTVLLTILLIIKSQLPGNIIIVTIPFVLLFALLLGIKEELFFRWILLRGFEKIIHSRLISVIMISFLWAIYHMIFGEAIGRDIFSTIAVFLISTIWSIMSYEYDSLWMSVFGHFCVELLGFYIMYEPLLKAIKI